MAFLEYDHLNILTDEDVDPEIHHQFDPYLFDSQYLRYTQVLDTDYENFMVLYTCQETGEFWQDDRHILPFEAWHHA